MGLAPLDSPILLCHAPQLARTNLSAHTNPTAAHRGRQGKARQGKAKARQARARQGKPHTNGRTRVSLASPVEPVVLCCPVLAANGVLLPLASLGLALPHLEGGCWPDASLRRGSDRSWTTLSQHGPQSFLPVAWPTSVLPKRSEWIWQIYYLSHQQSAV